MERQRGINMILWTCFIVFIAASVQGTKQLPQVEIDPKGSVAVRVGERLRIMCRIGTPVQNCRVEIPNENNILLRPNQPPEDGIGYDGEGFDRGQCGVFIENVKEKHDGIFKCALVPNTSRSEVIGQTRIVVAKAPNQPQLILSSGRTGGYKYEKGEKVVISCSAQSGRPAANVTLYFGNEPIGRESRSTMYDSNTNDNSLAVQNVSRSLDWTDNGKIVRCVAEHIALDKPKESQVELEVSYPPQKIPDIQRFGYVIGHPGIINLTVYANPRPNFVWRVDDEPINEGHTDKSQRLETSTAREVGKGAWYVELKIDSVQKSDTEKVYLLQAVNVIGTEEYKIALSTASEPEGLELDTGYIIGIVIGILVLLLLVSLIIFARATGRWCFAGGSSTRNIGESDIGDPAASIRLLRFHKPKTGDANSGQRSDTESAGRYSRSETDGGSGRPKRPRIMLSQLFKRNKDKVAGTDTDTMRTVVTVDDEKIPEPTDATQKTQTAEGGLVYAELDLTQREVTPPRRVSEDKTEYAEILYTKPEKDNDENVEKK